MASHKLSLLGRLKKRPEFLAVNAAQTKWVSATIIVQARPSENGFRFGVTATRKIGNAVVRNKVKRRLRTAMAEIARSESLKDFDIVLVGRDTTAACEWDQLLKDLKWCLRRLEVTA